MLKLTNKKVAIIAVLALATILQAPLASAQIIAQPADLPPGTFNYDGTVDGNLLSDPNVIAALIGVAGLLVGSVITILASYLIRWMDIRRDRKREVSMLEREKRDKEYQIKQELYRHFLNELAEIETFSQKSLDEVKRHWTKMEVKVDLIASDDVRSNKEKLQKALFTLAEKNLKNKAVSLPGSYINTRDELLKAIREDIDIFDTSNA